jgi:hypothetical protein
VAGKTRRNELQLLDERHKLASLKLSNPGLTSTELAVLYEATYGKAINPRTVRYDLKKLKEQWNKEMMVDVGKDRAHELVRLDNIEQTAWDAWRASMEPAEKIVVERLHKAINDAARAKIAGELAGELADKNEYITQEVLEAVIRDALEESLDHGEDSQTFINKITTTTEGKVGDPRFLAQIHEIQKERRKVLGVYSPELHAIQLQKIEVKGYKGGWSPDNWKVEEPVEGEIIPQKELEANNDEAREL